MLGLVPDMVEGTNYTLKISLIFLFRHHPQKWHRMRKSWTALESGGLGCKLL